MAKGTNRALKGITQAAIKWHQLEHDHIARGNYRSLPSGPGEMWEATVRLWE